MPRPTPGATRTAVASLYSASSIAVFHNHPSGDPTPSEDDLLLTSRMVNAGEVIGIDVLDHLILADQRYYSIVESGGFRRRAR